ncbi:MAG TPA: hypothetical protein VHA73_00910 [Acidimicrobiales bacterium]|jgi:hypothetical protein|nr:hypothetical protein [Acidimicrobiales bacterium]
MAGRPIDVVTKPDGPVNPGVADTDGDWPPLPPPAVPAAGPEPLAPVALRGPAALRGPVALRGPTALRGPVTDCTDRANPPSPPTASPAVPTRRTVAPPPEPPTEL